MKIPITACHKLPKYEQIFERFMNFVKRTPDAIDECKRLCQACQYHYQDSCKLLKSNCRTCDQTPIYYNLWYCPLNKLQEIL